MSNNASHTHSPRGHERIETRNALMIVLILLVVAVGGLVEIVPLFFQRSTTQAAPGVKPYTPLQLAGRDVYLREGCYNCHSRPPASSSTTTPSSGAASAPARTCTASAGATATNGTACT
jgi:cbb3-type cytochrome oxidase cytochrome c subunit